ncbi:MAG TPA: hydroxyphenylacetyl-CoA thioesterase PaaI [Gemmatimonadaceae bacterium]|nr:hydroxyphenylacetyl-CoA thioesterase PaaI [Gemmatimonadaceae bacterium]
MTTALNEQKLAERVVATMLERDAFSRWLGLEVTHVAPDAATVRMTVRAEMVNGFGVCHGGIAFSLADSALAFASNTHGRVTVSIENSIRYPAPIMPDDVLTATAVQESATRRLAFFNVNVTKQDGAVVGLFRGTVYRTSRDHFADETKT